MVDCTAGFLTSKGGEFNGLTVPTSAPYYITELPLFWRVFIPTESLMKLE